MKRLLVPALIILGTVISAQSEPTPGAVDVKRGLELWLPLQENFRDYSKNRHVGEVHGHLRLESDGATFDGEGDHILFPHLPIENGSFAISTWIQVTGNFGNYGILQQKNSGKKHEWLHLMLRDRMNPFFSNYVGNTRGDSSFTKTNGWRHLLVQYDAENQKTEIYVDGQLDATKKQAPLKGRGGPFIIGLTPKWSNVPASDFEGKLSDFRVYTRALNAREVAYLASLSSEG